MDQKKSVMDEYVWYAGYGSNIDANRFYRYIQGGILDITGRDHIGSRDRTLPKKQDTFTIHHELYFAKTSPPWENKAVAFLKAAPDASIETECVLYLVTKEQFIDIMAQENGEEPGKADIIPDLEAARRGEDSFIGNEDQYNWYGRLLYLGEHNEYPIYTFTAKDGDHEIVPAEPGANYLQVIGNGLMANMGKTADQASEYLLSKSGVANTSWTKERLLNLMGSRKFIVHGTNERYDPKGHFLVQLNKEDIDAHGLKRDTDVIVTHDTGRVEWIEGKKVKIKVKIRSRLQQSSAVKTGNIHLDQTVRAAIGVNRRKDQKGHYAVSIEKLSKKRNVPPSEWLFGFGRQRSMARVLIATFTDMEINICRIRESTMECIGVENGDKIMVESTTGTILIPALRLSEHMGRVRKKKQKKEVAYSVKKNLRWSTIKETYAIEDDLPWIFIDYDARNKLNVRPGDPVTIYRSNRHAISKNIQSLTVPLVALLIAIVQGLNSPMREILLMFHVDPSDMEDNIILMRSALYFVGSLLIIWFNLLPIRNKFR